MDTETGALSVEDAVAHLSIEEAVEDQPQTTEQPEIENDAPETVSDEAEEGADAEEDPADQSEDEPDLPVIDPPKSWDAEHKAKFEALPRDVQEYLTAREAERDKGVSAAQQRASEARQRADAEAQAVAALKPQIETLTAQAKQQLDRWSGMDATAWQRAAQQMDPREFNQLRADYDADVQRVQQLDAARQQAEAVEWQAFANAQTARLPEIAPHIASDPKAVAEVFEYVGRTIPNFGPEQRKWISAEEMLIAHKAMLYDRAKAPQPKPPGKKVITARPSTAPAPIKQRQAAQMTDRFKKSGSIDDAVAILNQRG